MKDLCQICSSVKGWEGGGEEKKKKEEEEEEEGGKLTLYVPCSCTRSLRWSICLLKGHYKW
jgi:hypothetical protein